MTTTTSAAHRDPAAAPRRASEAVALHRRRRRLCVAVVAVIVLSVVLSENIVYFKHGLRGGEGPEGQGTSRFRIAGAVVPGSIHETGDGVELRAHRRQADRARRAPRRPARAVQGLRAGRVRRPLGRGAHRCRSTATGS